MCEWLPIKCDGFSVEHSMEAMETRVMLLAPSRKPKNKLRAKFCINAGHSMIEVDGIARIVKGNVVVTGTAGDCRLVVVDDDTTKVNIA